MTELILFVVALGVRAFFALARSSLINLRRSRLAELAEKKPGAADAIARLTSDSSTLLATAEVGALMSLLFAASIATRLMGPPLAEFVSAQAVALANVQLPSDIVNVVICAVVVLVIGLPLFVFGRLVPEALAVRYAEPIALATIRPMQVSAALLAPFVRIAVWLSNTLAMPLGGRKLQTGSAVTDEEIKTMVDAGEEEGLIESQEKEMIYSVLDFGDTVAREVMVPRIDIVAVNVNTPLHEALDELVAAGHSRVPVYRDTIDDVIGFLYIKDFLRVLRDQTQPTIDQVMRPAHFTPESKRVSDLLREMQKSRTHVCIVVDEFGGTAGMVTIEDMLEEIVGEIQDELDAEEPDAVPLADGNGYELSAGMPIDDVAKLMRLDLPEQESDTLGGFIYDQLGEVPKAGAVVRFEDAIFEVLSVEDRRILKVRATQPAPADEAKASDSKPAPADDARSNMNGYAPQT